MNTRQKNTRAPALPPAAAFAAAMIFAAFASPPAFSQDHHEAHSLNLSAPPKKAAPIRPVAAPAPKPLELWYNKASAKWLDALPLGNGRLGVMVWGQTHHETLSLNDTSCWSGEPGSNNIPEGPKLLAEMRKQIFAGNWDAIRELMPQTYGKRENFGTNLDAGRLFLDFLHQSKHSRRYRRALDLQTGIATVSYENSEPHSDPNYKTREEIVFNREIFVSNPDQVMVVRLTASQPGSLTFHARLDGAENPFLTSADGADLLLEGDAFETLHSDGKTGVRYSARVRILNEGGSVRMQKNRLHVEEADSVTLLLALNTSFTGIDPTSACKAQIEAAAKKSYQTLRQTHVADHRGLFDRVAIDLGKSPNPNMPLDRRLEAVRKGTIDPALDALIFQYARYLMIAGSRENSPLPMHLQGIWNDNLCSRMPWSADQHLDINLAMQYWIAETGNLSECHMPLMHWIRDWLAPSGRKTARIQYGAEGWMADAMSNAWGYTAPGWAGWTPFISGGAWIGSHLWDHYDYTGDKKYLQETAYPLIKGLAEFYVSYMTRHPQHGWLVTGPSVSPENSFVAPDGKRISWSMSPTVDIALVRQTFESTIAAGEILGVDSDFREKLKAMLPQLPPCRAGRHGQLQEWLEDYEEALPGHRHISHLLGVYPFSQINVDDTPALARAARVSVDRRVAGTPKWEGVDCSWTTGLVTIYMARLRDAEAAHGFLQKFISGFAFDNLLGVSWAGQAGTRNPIYCLDGNGGAAIAVAEMLMQGYNGRILLLPALPKAWPDGSVKGLCARGGFEVDVTWKKGRLAQAAIRSKLGGPCSIKPPDSVALAVTCDGAPVRTTIQNGLVHFETQAGRSYNLAAK